MAVEVQHGTHSHTDMTETQTDASQGTAKDTLIHRHDRSTIRGQ